MLSKPFFFVFFLGSTGFFAWWSYTSVSYKTLEHNLTSELHMLEKGYLDRHIIQAIEEENFDDVDMYQNLAMMLHITLLPSTLSNIESHNGFLEKSWSLIVQWGCRGVSLQT